MKKVKVTLLSNVFRDLTSSLQWDGREKAAYLLCHSSTCQDRIKLLPHKVLHPENDDYVKRSAGAYVLGKPFINRALNEAIDTGSDFIQCHIHPPGCSGTFSYVDEVEEPKFMRHIAEKIDGIYHASLVFGNSLDTLDGWIYDRENDQLNRIEKVVVVGKETLKIFVVGRNSTKDGPLSSTLDRTIMAYGEQLVRLLKMLDVAVVGASALGSPVLEFLVRDRVQSALICDPDIIDETNLNRLPGTTPEDIGRPKVDFYGEMMSRINPEIETTLFQNSFYDEEVQIAFSQADILFGCVDSGARHSMNRLALGNLIPYFDLGAGIELKNGTPTFIGGQVYSVIPGREVCLSCSGAFSNLLSEYLSPKELERERRQGYITGQDDGTNPLVMWLDYVISGLGYNQFLKYVSGRANGEVFKLHYNEISNRTVASTCSSTGCITCESGGFLGKGDKVPFMMPNEDRQLRIPEVNTR